MTRAERIACCEQQAQRAEVEAKRSPGRKDIYSSIAAGWRSLAAVLTRA